MIAVLGAGPIGAAVAHRLAERARIREIRLVDENVSVASGKALDIRQSGPIDRFDVDLTASRDPLAVTGADVVVLADSVDDGEWRDERGLSLVARLVQAGTKAAFVFAGPSQSSLMELASRKLSLDGDRVLGAAGAAHVSAARALIGLELGLSGTGVRVTLAGRPPAFTVGWTSASVDGSLVSELFAPHRMLAISSSLTKLWPPGPQAIGAATARLVEGLALGSREPQQALVILDGEFAGVRGVAGMLPLMLGHRRVLRRLKPTLSPQETTAVVRGF